MNAPVGATAPDHRWLALLAHEMRSPLGAILGYQELLLDGTLGQLDPRAADGVRRLGIAAAQLAALIDGVDALAAATAPPTADVPPASISAASLIASVLDVLQPEAELRGVILTADGPDASLICHIEHAAKALLLATGAALKAPSDGHIRISTATEPMPAITISGCALSPDDLVLRLDDRELSGAGLRLLLARKAAEWAGGQLLVEHAGGGVIIRLVFAAPPAG